MSAASAFPSGTVTFLFSDIEESTRAWDIAAPEMEQALARHNDLLRAAVDTRGGAVVKTTGDGVMAVFADAGAAVAAAVEAQRAITAEPWPTPAPLRVRIGVHTGAATEENGDYVGIAPTKAARIMAAAHGGQVLLSGATAGLLGPEIELLDLGTLALRGLEQPEHVHQVVAPGLRSDFPPPRTLARRRHNLPAERNRFVGRETEVTAVREAIAGSRLTTLTGIGGCGKTRLALEVARRLVDDFGDGAWFIDLTTTTDEAQISSAVLAALGVPTEVSAGQSPDEALVAYLARQHLLLVLDNCEHLIDGCAAIVDRLLEECPSVTVLTTSREALEIEGERSYRVPSLGVPEDDDTPADTDAVRLFVERAGAVVPGFSADDHLTDVVEICRRLDGIPLAIELAAARVAHLSPEEITRRLDDRFRLLTGRARRRVQRQQTLAATLDWSWDLLHDDERVLLRRLAVFPARFRLDATEGVCGFGPATMDLLASLVDKSLVAAIEVDGAMTYRLLETMRLYAQQRLVEAGEAEEFRSRHCEWFAMWARTLVGPCDLWATGRATTTVADWDNLHAAIEWALSTERLTDAVDMLRVAMEIASNLRGAPRLDQVGAWSDALVDRREELPVERAGEILVRGALVSMLRARFDEMVERAEAAIAAAGDDCSGVLPMAFTFRGLQYVFDDPTRTVADVGEALARARDADQVHIRLMSQTIGAGAALVMGDLDRAIVTYEAVLDHYANREWEIVAWNTWNELADAYLIADRADLAERLVQLGPGTDVTRDLEVPLMKTYAQLLIAIHGTRGTETPAELLESTHALLQWAFPLSDQLLVGVWIELARARDDAERVAELLGYQRARAAVSGWRSPSQLPLYRSRVAWVRTRLDDETARAARDRGGSQSLEELLARDLAGTGVG